MVNNGLSDSEPDTVSIEVIAEDPLPPIAEAGENIKDAYDCSSVELDGTDSYDPNGDLITYEWAVQSIPKDSSASSASIINRNSATTSFYPDVVGTYMLSLVVNDGTEWSTPDLISITVAERPYNTAPVVEAGKGWTIDAGEAACEEDGYSWDCDSCASVSITLGTDAAVQDSDGDPMALLWELLSESSAEITDPTSLETLARLTDATPVEPGACEDTEYTFQLGAIDCPGEQGTDTVTFTVTCCGTKQKDTGK